MSLKITRRDLLKLGGLGLSSAVLTGCGPAARYVARRPYTDMPEYNQTGMSTYYATACRECPAGCGLILRTKEGRALQAAGNPEHPVNQGKICSRGLTAVQGLYSPERIKAPRRQYRGQGDPSEFSWEEAITEVSEGLKKGDKSAFLLGMVPDHLYDLITELSAASGAQVVRYGALNLFEGRATLAKAAESVYGVAGVPYFDLNKADVVFSFGANFLETWVSPMSYSRGYSQMRRGEFGKRGYLVAFEPRQSLTAASADEWVPLVPGTEGLVAQAIGVLIERRSPEAVAPMFANVDIAEVARVSGVSEEKLRHLAELFVSGVGMAIPGAGVVGRDFGLLGTRAVLALNLFSGEYLPVQPADGLPAPLVEVKNLVSKMMAGEIDTLFVHGVNPIFDLPAALGFSEALSKVGKFISFASFPDETALASDLVLPDHSALESWGYQRTVYGYPGMIYSASQPVVVPLYDTRATVDVLLQAAQGAGFALSYTDEVDFLQKQLLAAAQRTDGSLLAPDLPTFWSMFLQKGGWWGPAYAMGLLPPGVPGTVTAPPVPSQLPEGNFYLTVFATQLGDGSGANRPWLQETPDPMTTAMWNTWVEIHPETAKKLGLHDDDIVTLRSSSGEMQAVVYLYPAIRPDTVAVPFGQGHTALGDLFAAGRGANPLRIVDIRLNENGDLALGDTQVTLTPTGNRRLLSRMESRTGIYGGH